MRLAGQQEFDSQRALKAGRFSNKMTRDRTLKKMVEMGLVKCVAESVGNTPARWRWTDKSLDELVLPTVETVCVTA